MDPSRRLENMVQVVSYQEASELVLSKHIRQAKDGEVNFMPLKKDILVMLYGQAHTDRRRIENPLFARHHLLRYEHDVLEASLERQLAELFATNRHENSVSADLIRLSRFSLLPVTAALVGLEVEQNQMWWERLSEFVRMFAVAAALQWKEGDIEQERQESLDAAEQFDQEVFTPAFERRLAFVERFERGDASRESLPNDLITALLLHLPGRPHDLILRETIQFFSASTDTSTMAVATAINHLHEWFRQHPEDKGRHEDLGFVQRAVFEAIRLHPPPGLIRSAYEEIVLSNGRVIPAGREIFIDLYAVNRDPEVFGSDSAEFNPRRELAAGVKPYAFGFGGGAHKCIGRPLATSHDEHSNESDPDGAIGSVVRIVRRLLELGVRLDPEKPPTLRPGWRQERYLSFPILLAPSATADRVSA